MGCGCGSILPLDPRNGSSNDAGIALLAENGVQVRVTAGQYPPADTPYMHAKTMIVDGRLAYLGSIDLQTASTSEDRELGITFQAPRLVARLRAQFQSDWAGSSVLAASIGSGRTRPAHRGRPSSSLALLPCPISKHAAPVLAERS